MMVDWAFFLLLAVVGRPGLASTTTTSKACAPFSDWPNVDNGVTCGSCRALVKSQTYGNRCDKYCESFGHVCIAAEEEKSESCNIKRPYRCDEVVGGSTSDILCTCQLVTTEIAAVAGTVTPPFALAGGHVELPGPAGADCPHAQGAGRCGGQILFHLYCKAAAQVAFEAEILAPDDKSDSFNIRLDEGPESAWHTGTTQQWGWSTRSPSLNASQGNHNVILAGREDGIKLKTLRIAVGSGVCGFQGKSTAPTTTTTRASHNVVEINAAGVGGWGGQCICPDGEVLWAGDNSNGCASLACVNGVSGTCNKFEGKWSRKKVLCRSASMTTTSKASSAAGPDPSKCSDKLNDCCALDKWSEPKTCSSGYIARPDPDPARKCSSTNQACKVLEGGIGCYGCYHPQAAETTRALLGAVRMLIEAADMATFMSPQAKTALESALKALLKLPVEVPGVCPASTTVSGKCPKATTAAVATTTIASTTTATTACVLSSGQAIYLQAQTTNGIQYVEVSGDGGAGYGVSTRASKEGSAEFKIYKWTGASGAIANGDRIYLQAQTHQYHYVEVNGTVGAGYGVSTRASKEGSALFKIYKWSGKGAIASGDSIHLQEQSTYKHHYVEVNGRVGAGYGVSTEREKRGAAEFKIFTWSKCQASTTTACANFSDWPNVDKGVTCGSCRALVRAQTYGNRCDRYCESFGHICISAAEDRSNSCENEERWYRCDEVVKAGTSDILCTCQLASTTTTSKARRLQSSQRQRAHVDFRADAAGSSDTVLLQAQQKMKMIETGNTAVLAEVSAKVNEAFKNANIQLQPVSAVITPQPAQSCVGCSNKEQASTAVRASAVAALAAALVAASVLLRG